MITCVLCGATTADGVEHCPRHGCGAALAVQDLYARHAVQVGFGVPPLVRLEPGDVVTLPVRVRNAGREAGQFTVHAVDMSTDLGAGWAAVETSVLKLDPGMLGSAVLRLRAPRSGTSLPGRRAVTVEAASAARPSVRARADLRVDVMPFVAFDARLVPDLIRPRRQAAATLRIVNTGTVEVRPTIECACEANTIAVECAAATLPLPVGEAVSVPVRFRVRHPRWFRRPAPRMVEVVPRFADVERACVARVEALPRFAPFPRRRSAEEAARPLLRGGAHERGGIAGLLLPRGVPRGLAVACVAFAFLLSGLLTAHYDGLLGGTSSSSPSGGPTGGANAPGGGVHAFAAASGQPDGLLGTASPTATATGTPRSATPTASSTSPSASGSAAGTPSPPPGTGTPPASTSGPGVPLVLGSVVSSAAGSTSVAVPPPPPVVQVPPPAGAGSTAPNPAADAGAVKIPDVCGDPEAQAVATLARDGFTDVRASAPSGTVVDMSPHAGLFTAPYTLISLTVSGGPASTGAGC